jgi:hypothetical protein
MTLRYSLKDLLSGLIFIALGLAFGIAASGYQIGTALRMGPGYFPIILAVVLVALGISIVVQSFASGPDEVAIGDVPWFGMILVTASLFFFGLTVRGLGLAPSLFVSVALTAFASKRTGPLGAIVISAGLTAMCMVIFIWALGLPLPMVGRWLAF